MKVIVAHPGKQHSYRLASALKKSNYLKRYVTTLYNKKNNWFLKILRYILSNDNKKRANGRINHDLDDEDVHLIGQIGGYIEALLYRLDKKRTFYRYVREFDSKIFGIKLARYAIAQKVDALICYDSNAEVCFNRLKKYGSDIKRIMDVSIAARPYMKSIYDLEISRSGHDDLKYENSYMWRPSRLNKSYLEIEDTQFFLVASNFVKDSLVYCGVNPKQIKIVPYGANVESNINRYVLPPNTRIEFLFVGQVVYRKGITYLLESMKSFESCKAHLTVTGSYNSSDWFVKENLNKSNISFTGLVTIDKMRAIYEKSHVFVLPSFAEGMAQVGIEAMACGLPVICTYNSGVADLVSDGVNGFIVPVGDKQVLEEKMQWFIDHPDKILEMGEAARKVASNYSWSDYERRVVKAINEIMEN